MFDRDCPLKLAAQQSPLECALILPDRSLSFQQLDTLAEIWADRLRQYDIGEGDRVAFLLPPSADAIALMFAIWRCKACFCPLNLRLPSDAIATILPRLDPKLYITQTQMKAFATADRFALSPSALIFTSGSSAAPKVAILSRESLLFSAASSLDVLDLRTKDRWLLSLPLYHVGGIGIVLRCILAQASIGLDSNDPQITHLSCVPTQLHKAWPVYRRLKCLLLGGAPIHEVPSHLPIFTTYGLTEMGSIVTLQKNCSASMSSEPLSVYLGSVLQGRELRIDESGEIWIRGRTLFSGYWNQGTIERPFDSNGWFATKDKGHIDPIRGLFIEGRKDWMFISGGENIQPEEIEGHLHKIPGIIEAVVAPINDALFGSRPIAIVKTNRTDLSLQSVQNTLTPYLPKYKIPIALFFVEELPKMGSKIDRKKIFESIKNNALENRDFIQHNTLCFN